VGGREAWSISGEWFVHGRGQKIWASRKGLKEFSKNKTGAGGGGAGPSGSKANVMFSLCGGIKAGGGRKKHCQ